MRYTKEDKTFRSSISGGRLHRTYKGKTKSRDTYKYELSYGENLHTLSMVIFGTDEEYWRLADLNKPRDVFKYTVGSVVILPNSLIFERSLKIFV